MIINKSNIRFWRVVFGLSALLGLFLTLFVRDMTRLNKAYEDLNLIESMSSSTQRIIRLRMMGELDDQGLYYLAEISQKTLNPKGGSGLSVLDKADVVFQGQRALESWNVIEDMLKEPFLEWEDLSEAGDVHFFNMAALAQDVTDYTSELNGDIIKYQGIMSLLLTVLGAMMLQHIIKTEVELKQSNKLAKTAQIDVATGLFNRSRCQELFKTNSAPSLIKHPAVMVLDLNDLKKVNDTLGHRAGDELIQSFATVLQAASVVHVVTPFIGRYGGDEFVVVYENVDDEEELKTFMKELRFVVDQFNEKETKFQLSYALGYAYVGHDADETLTIRQLFDKADEAMYVNKAQVKAMKLEQEELLAAVSPQRQEQP